MDHPEDEDLRPLDQTDRPIRARDQLSYITSLKFWAHSSGERKISQALHRGHDPIDGPYCISRRVTCDKGLDEVQVLGRGY